MPCPAVNTQKSYTLQKWSTRSGQVCTRPSVCSHLFWKTPGSISSGGKTRVTKWHIKPKLHFMHWLRSMSWLPCPACSTEGRPTTGRGPCGGSSRWQVGHHCGPPVGQTSSQRCLQRTRFWNCQGRLAGCLHGSR